MFYIYIMILCLILIFLLYKKYFCSHILITLMPIKKKYIYIFITVMWRKLYII